AYPGLKPTIPVDNSRTKGLKPRERQQLKTPQNPPTNTKNPYPQNCSVIGDGGDALTIQVQIDSKSANAK
ncbi:MAG: hypothetical protein KIT74_01620, partial [Fimbriimonadales bacterium]|nr:hypothetical protein [Fimbriimonadales bacterium]